MAKHAYAIATAKGKIYVLGGCMKQGNDIWVSTSSVQAYDPITDTWEESAKLPVTIDNGAAASIDNKIVIAGGWIGNSITNRAYVFDTENNTWKQRNSLTKVANMAYTTHNNSL